MSAVVRTLTIVAAVGAATAAGTFFTFSTFTMAGLKRLSPTQGAEAMQAINEEAPTPPFMALLFGTGVVCVALGTHAARHLDDTAARYQLAACVLYVLGVVVMTGVYHVPRNDRLAALDPASAEGTAYWATYLREWVRMNHVRTIAPLAAAVLLAVSLQAA